jgi:hypothetical protein
VVGYGGEDHYRSKVKKGKETDFSKLLRELRTKAIPPQDIFQARRSGQWMTLIITLSSPRGRVWAIGRNGEESGAEEDSGQNQKLMARATKTRIFVHA